MGTRTRPPIPSGVGRVLAAGLAAAAPAQGLQQSCFGGSWAGAILDGRADERGRTVLGSAFERVQAFRVGFLDGEAACAAYTEGE